MKLTEMENVRRTHFRTTNFGSYDLYVIHIVLFSYRLCSTENLLSLCTVFQRMSLLSYVLRVSYVTLLFFRNEFIRDNHHEPHTKYR